MFRKPFVANKHDLKLNKSVYFVSGDSLNTYS